jgi:hypothetical protein
MNDPMKATKPLMGLLVIALCGLLPATAAHFQVGEEPYEDS